MSCYITYVANARAEKFFGYFDETFRGFAAVWRALEPAEENVALAERVFRLIGMRDRLLLY